MIGLAERIARDQRDRIEISSEEFADWLDDRTRRLPGFDSRGCFERPRREFSRGRTSLTSGLEGITFFLRGGPHGQLIVDVLCRRGVPPELSPGQFAYLHNQAMNAPDINPDVIEKLRRDALSKEWPNPAAQFGCEGRRTV